VQATAEAEPSVLMNMNENVELSKKTASWNYLIAQKGALAHKVFPDS